jgi:hypothetical protein
MAEELQPAGPLLAVAFEAALLLVEFFAAPGVAHEPEAAGGVDLQAGPDGTKERLAGGGLHLARVEGQGALGAGVGLGQQGALAEDLAAGQREEPADVANTLGLAVSDPPTQSEMQQIADKLDELINALRR